MYMPFSAPAGSNPSPKFRWPGLATACLAAGGIALLCGQAAVAAAPENDGVRAEKPATGKTVTAPVDSGLAQAALGGAVDEGRNPSRRLHATKISVDSGPSDGIPVKQRLVGYEIIHELDVPPEGIAGRAESLPVGVPIPVWEVHNDESPVLRGSVAAAQYSGCEAIVYRQPNDNGYFLPKKAMDVGNFMANPLALGNGFQFGDEISGFDVLVYNSVSGDGDASVEFSLWDGDPLGIIDTHCSNPPQPIPGTTVTFSGLVKGGFDTNGCIGGFCDSGYLDGTPCIDDTDCGLCPAYADPYDGTRGCAGLYRLRATLDPPVVLNCTTEPYLVMEVTEGCRLGWRLAYYAPPDVGRGYGAVGCASQPGPCTDFIEEGYECGQGASCGTASGYSAGTCCDTGVPCDHTDAFPENWTGNCGPGSARYETFCSSGVADTLDAWYYGAPTYYASFVATAYAPADPMVSLVPRMSSGSSTIEGNEITLTPGQQIWFDIHFADWDQDLDGSPQVKTWEARIDAAGYSSGIEGALTPWNPSCSSDDDCTTLLGQGSLCNDPGYPPGGCAPGFMDFSLDPVCPNGLQGCLQLDLPAIWIGALDFRYGSTTIFSPAAVDDGNPHYAGTLVLDVPTNASGTFTVGFQPVGSYLRDTSNTLIPLLGICPAYINVMPEEACCRSDGGCELLGADDCRFQGGVPLGPGTTCAGDGDGDGTDDACVPDPYTTLPGVGVTSAYIGNSVIPPVPADFFGPGSDPFDGTIVLGPASLSDTEILRSGDPIQPGDPVGQEGTVAVELVKLSLVSTAPITVTYNGGQDPELWDVAVTLSDSPAGKGQLTATKTHENGGTFTMSLPVRRTLTFTKVGDPGEVWSLDSPEPSEDPLVLTTTAPAHWVHTVTPELNLQVPDDGFFVPGVKETMPPSGEVAMATTGLPEAAVGVTGMVGEGLPFDLRGDEDFLPAGQTRRGTDCPEDSLFTQPVQLSGWIAGTSDAAIELLRYESFAAVAGPICDIHWWGIDLFHDGIAWGECTENPMPFEIRFYQDAGGIPGAEVCSYAPTVTGVFAADAAGYDLWEYSVDFDPCCNLTDGWVSIQGDGATNCWFLWMSSETGDASNCFDDGATIVCGLPDNDFDLSFCLTPFESMQLVVPFTLGNLDADTWHSLQPPSQCLPSAMPEPEQLALPGSPINQKVRHLSFTAGDSGRQQAVRVTFVDLPVPYNLWNGTRMWVGPPQVYCENAGQTTPPAGGCGSSGGLPLEFQASTLQCSPYYRDWTTLDVVHLFHEGIVPQGLYDIQVVDELCLLTDPLSYSDPATMTTARWGDTVGDCTTNPCSPPDGTANVTTDVTAILDKFKNLPGNITKARADIEPCVLDQAINITDVTQSLDAFKGLPYPCTPSGPPPCSP